MRNIVFGLLGVVLMAGTVTAADISAFTAPYSRAGGAITFTEKLTPGNLQAAVSVTMPEVAYTTGAGTAQYRGGSWSGATGSLAAEQGIIRLLGFDPAWSALPNGAVKREGNTITITAGGTYTIKLDPGTGRILSTTTPQRSFHFTYATALPVASRVEVRRSGRTIGQALRSSIAGGQASSSSMSGLGNLLGIGGNAQPHSATATAGSRGLGDAGDGSEAQAFTEGGSAEAVGALTETGLPAITVTDEELERFLAEGGLHLPAAPVVAE